MGSWSVLLDVLLLLSTATALGIACACLKQSPIIGYLAAGTLMGPNVLGFVGSGDEVEILAELGIALLLFTIGLEFSWRRLIGLGRVAIGGGFLQVLVTLLLVASVCLLVGVPVRSAWALGAIIALSSTACVLRLLVSRAEIESHHGRHALGILLVQDAAVVPLVLLVALLGGEGGLVDAGWALARVIGGAAVLVGGLYVILRYGMPWLLRLDAMRHSRDLPILVAVVVGLGAAWASHEFGLSPALGAFVAGMLLAASPFATQVRADVASLQTLLVTLFFGSIGMLGDPAWLIENLGMVVGVVAAIIVGKAVIVWAVLRGLGLAHESALMAGLCLAQVGEFSFILAMSARGTLISDDTLRLLVSATIISLFLTPYLVSTAPWLAPRIIASLRRIRLVSAPAPPVGTPATESAGRILVVGFGPAGQAVGRMLAGHDREVVVLDLNFQAIKAAQAMGLVGHVGDATHEDVLHHAGVRAADTVVVTIPDPAMAERIVRLVRVTAPDAYIIARARYHRFVEEIRASGAHELVDEEAITGTRLAAHLRRRLANPS
ncbi:MAG: cation:proton antiporter [Phycisphaera sp.]|nr:MAG: cation:proton antiporter [Phycisphaera sp.]